MSSKPTDRDNQLQEDEAFIDALYQQLPAEDEQQPSEFLDKRIITAAYQAVATKPTKINKRKITWFHSLATAASLTLVVSLVVQQQSHILPSADTGADLVSNSQKDYQSSDDEMMILETATALSAAMPVIDNESTNDSYATTQYDKQMTIAQPMMVKEIAEKSIVVNGIADKSIVAKQSKINQRIVKRQSASAEALMPAPLTSTPLTSTEVALKNQPYKIENKSYQSTARIQQKNLQDLAATKRPLSVNDSTANKLSVTQYQLYTVQNAQLSADKKLTWSLINEQTDSYYITIYLPDNNTRSYRLAKTHFKLNTLSVKAQDKHTLNKQLFSEIIVKNEQ